LRRQVNVIAEAAHLDSRRMLAWVVAWAGLSAALLLEDGAASEGEVQMIELAAAALNG
jgi:streptomycin 6-kinase